jgi:hypothetical protein
MILKNYLRYGIKVDLKKRITGFFIERFLLFNLKKKIRFKFINKFCFYNSNRSKYFHSFQQCFLKVKLEKLKYFKNLISRMNLLRLRFEIFNSDSHHPFNFTRVFAIFKKKTYASLNKLVIIPKKNRKISFNASKIIFKKFFLSKKVSILFCFWFYFFNKITKNVGKQIINFDILILKLKFKIKSIPDKKNLNKIIATSKNYSWVNCIINILKYEKRKYIKQITIIYIRTGLMKVNKFFFYGSLISVNRTKNYSSSKVNVSVSYSIDPAFSQVNRDFNFSTLNLFSNGVYGFQILSSKKKIPLKLFTIFENSSVDNLFLKKKSSNFLTEVNVLSYVSRFNFKINYKKLFDFQNSAERTTSTIKSKVCLIFNQLIVKEANDFHDELGAIIILSQFEKILREYQVTIWLNSLCFNSYFYNGGSVEVIPNSRSIHEIKSYYPSNYFDFEVKKSSGYIVRKKSIENFLESLAGYSLFCYLLQIKDRHNANILLNKDNRIIHIDFAFILGSLPGNLKLEAESFKMSEDFTYIIMGEKSQFFDHLKEVFTRGFMILRKNAGTIIKISKFFILEGFLGFRTKQKLLDFIKRFELKSKNLDIIRFCNNLFKDSLEDWRTKQYDKYQMIASGIKL